MKKHCYGCDQDVQDINAHLREWHAMKDPTEEEYARQTTPPRETPPAEQPEEK